MDRTSQGLKIILRNNDGTTSDITMYSDDGKMPSTIEIGGAVKTTDVRVSEIEVDEDEPLINEKDAEDSESSHEILTALCALATSVIMIMTLVKFFSTSHIAGAWPTNPKLYPTYLLLITSLVTLVIDVFSLGERYCGNASKKNVDTIISKMRYTLLVFPAIGAATGAGVFKATEVAGSTQDLFGWACSDAADQMANVNSSDLVCNSNTGSSVLSVLQTCLHVLGIIITVVTMLAPKGDNTKDNGDEEAVANTDKKTKRASCATCGTPSQDNKSRKKKLLAYKEKSDDQPKPAKSDLKSDEPQIDTEAIQSIVKQSQALYTRLQPSDGKPDLNTVRVNHYGDQTGYSQIDMSSQDVPYDNYDMQNFP